MIIDITSQKELESRKDNFMSMASHELKTPLTSALVFSQVVKKQFNRRKYRETGVLLDKLDSQLQKLSLLVQDLLDTTRMQKGKVTLRKEKFKVRDLVKEVAEELKLVSEHKLTLDWHTTNPVYADKERIRQVLSNLITNAIKYSPEDTKIIIASQKKDHVLQVSVQDFGIGIESKDQNKIFERFYQAGDSSTFPGLGLGLFISSEIIKQHGGKMWVESKNGSGSTFFFTIPIMTNSN